jgi:hypothetical protein
MIVGEPGRDARGEEELVALESVSAVPSEPFSSSKRRATAFFTESRWPSSATAADDEEDVDDDESLPSRNGEKRTDARRRADGMESRLEPLP